MLQSKPFPIPVVSLLGPGSQAVEEPMEFMPMPSGMNTYRAPVLPEPEALAEHGDALAALRAVLDALRRHLGGEAVEPVRLAALSDADRALVNQVLGEGEVAAQSASGGHAVQAQESVFAGVWRVLHLREGQVVRDTIEVGAFPQAIGEAALADGRPLPPLPPALPQGTMNSPAVLEELRERSRAFRAGEAAHVVNLSLLPLTPEDSEFFEQQLGRGSVMVLSRGYGNCRVVNTRAAHVWRVTYFNSQDMIILDTLEVGAVPEVACAARQDLEDSAERLTEVLEWVAQA